MIGNTYQRVATLALLTVSLAGRAADPGAIAPLQPGLVFTTTTRAKLVTNAGSIPVADMETVYSIGSVGPDKVVFGFRVAAPADRRAAELLETAPQFSREVLRQDLAAANRMSVLLSSTDPTILPGQTFRQTSATVLKGLESGDEVSFVLGINEDGGIFSPLALPSAATSTGPIDIGSLLALTGAVRHYYRGTIRRIEPGTVPFSVVVDGERRTVPAIHPRGDLKFSTKPLVAEFWWLAEAEHPLTLKWVAGNVSETVTRINRPQSGRDDSAARITSALAGGTCRAELPGLYFSTGSATLLPESAPALQRVVALMQAHADWALTIEGHTDNIGTADYNLDLSKQRAASVRTALVARYPSVASRLSSAGYGLTRPVESNDAETGRARNRRVEISRHCN